MNRTALQRLEKWKNASDRKPLLVQGARQVGKTWLMKEFGAKYPELFIKNILFLEKVQNRA